MAGERIVANEKMQTSVPHIYAAGDCTGPHEIVHIAIQQGETAGYNLAHVPQISALLTNSVAMSLLSASPLTASGTEMYPRTRPYFATHAKASSKRCSFFIFLFVHFAFSENLQRHN